jgi:NitT/TauT family transport system substrate-binding protein
VVRRGWFALGAAGCSAAYALGAAPRALAQMLQPLHLGIAPSDGVTSVVYAKQAGLFEKAGLDVTYQTQHNGAAVAAAVLSGFFDIGNTSITSLLLAHEHGLPFTLVAPAGIYDAKDPFTGALVLKDSSLQLGRDAEGQVIAVASLDSTGHDCFAAWVDHHGGDWRQVKFIEVPLSAAAAAVAEHRVAAAESATPAMETAMETGKFRLIPVYSGFATRFLISAWFTSRDFSSKHPDIVKTFARVVAAAGAYANTHHAETAPAMAQLTGIPLATFSHMMRAEEGTVLVPSLIQPVIDAAHTYGTLGRAFPAREIIDPNVLDLHLR